MADPEEFRGIVERIVVPSWSVTVPLGAPALGATGETVTVKVRA